MARKEYPALSIRMPNGSLCGTWESNHVKSAAKVAAEIGGNVESVIVYRTNRYGMETFNDSVLVARKPEDKRGCERIHPLPGASPIGTMIANSRG